MWRILPGTVGIGASGQVLKPSRGMGLAAFLIPRFSPCSGTSQNPEAADKGFGSGVCVFSSWDSPQKANLGSRLKSRVTEAEDNQDVPEKPGWQPLEQRLVFGGTELFPE